jgi:uncharacterized protein (TIGR03435 family)
MVRLYGVRRHIAHALLVILPVGATWAQSQAQPRFDVASIKPSDPTALGGYVRFQPGGRLEVNNVQLIFLIQNIYGVRDFQIVGAPKWITDWNTARFDIEAKAEGATSEEQLGFMAQNLLEDRFQLKFHRETRELPVYLLTPGKGGVKLQATPDNGRPRGSGGLGFQDRGWLQGQNVSMESFVKALSQFTDHPVVDRTSYSEAFTFKLQWMPEKSPDGRGDPPADAVRPAFSTALQQMGLKLEAQKAPIEVLVIDRVERPSEN